MWPIFLSVGLLLIVSFSACASERYIDGGDVVVDPEHKLMWKKCSEGQHGNQCIGSVVRYTWVDAMSGFEKNVSFAGYDDWRMPTYEELQTLVWCSNGTQQKEAWDEWCEGRDSKRGDYQQPTIDLKLFPNTDSWFYWSSSVKDASYARLVYFDCGYSNWNGHGYEGAVRLVRSLR